MKANDEADEETGFVVALTGKPGFKRIDGERLMVTPFVGADREGKDAQVGVGLLLGEGGRACMWGHFSPRCLIRSWRAMQMLQRLDRIDIGNGILARCWEVCRANLHPSEQDSLSELERMYGNRLIHDIRNKVLSLAPSIAEVETMIRKFQEYGIDVAGWELKEEIGAHHLIESELITKVIADDERDRDRIRARWEEQLKPMPPEESLGHFLQRIGADLKGQKPEEIDRRAKGHCMDRFPWRGRHWLSYVIDEDHIGHPKRHQRSHVTLDDGTTYIFVWAYYRQGRFLIKVQSRKKEEDTFITRGEFAIPQLLAMISCLPFKKKLKLAAREFGLVK